MASEPLKVQAIFNPSETDHMVRCVELAVTSAKRAQNNSRNPEFGPIHDKIVAELEALLVKIKGIHAQNK